VNTSRAILYFFRSFLFAHMYCLSLATASLWGQAAENERVGAYLRHGV